MFQDLGYRPTAPQQKLHFSPARERAASGGERSGKSFMGAKEVVGECFLGDLYWIVGPNYELARPEFSYVKDDLEKMGAIAKGGLSFPKEGPCSITTLWGTQIVTKSSVDAERLGAVPPDGILMTEAAQHSRDAFDRLRARTAQKRAWLLLTGTLERATRWYAELIQVWLNPENVDGALAVILPTSSNYHIFPGGVEDPELIRQRARLGDEVFMERFGGVPVPPGGLVFREVVRDLPHYFQDGTDYVPGLPVDVAIDPGWDNPYAILQIQEVPQRDKPGEPPLIWVFDELYARYTSTRDMQKILKKLAYFATIRGGAIDVSARQHKDSDKTTLAQWQYPSEEEGFSWPGLPIISRYVNIQAGIDRFRTLLYRMRFSPRCAGLYNEFFHYKYHQTEDKRWDVKPVDAHNHSIKALIYWCANKYGLVTPSSTEEFVDFRMGG